MKNRITRFICMVVLVACQKESITERSYPRVVTKPVDGITKEGAVFHGEISSNSVEIIDHGFTWSTSKSFLFAEVISLGKRTSTGNFDAFVERSMATGVKYYVYAFAKSAKHTVYGNVVEFVSLGSKSPKILSFSPARAKTLDTVRIAGKHFSSKNSDNVVKFDVFAAEVVNSSDTLLLVRVPQLLNKQKSAISISVLGNIGNSTTQFELLGPEISSVSKTTVKVCDTLSVFGSNFNTVISQMLVKINDVTCKVLSTSATQVRVLVPSFLPASQNVTLKVSSSNIEKTYGSSLTYLRPLISSVSSLTNITFSDTITFNGILPACENILVKIGDKDVIPLMSNRNQLKIVVPTFITTSRNSITIAYGQNAFNYQVNFDLRQPLITTIDPSAGTFGDVITITGKYFSPLVTGSKVNIGGALATITSASSTSIKAKISDESAKCSVNNICDYFLLETAGYQVSGSGKFTFRRPVVSLVSPSNVTAEGAVTISGKYFSPINDYNFVRIGSQTFRALSSSPTQITVDITRDYLSNGNLYYSNNRTLPLSVLVSTEPTSANGLVSNGIDLTLNYKGPWTKKASFPGSSRFKTGNFSIGDRAYVCLGIYLPDQTYSDQVWEYNSVTDGWRRLANFPGSKRKDQVSFSIGGKGYIALGFSEAGTYLKDVWEYNPSTDSWTQLSDFPGGVRTSAYSFVVNDKAYIGGGEASGFPNASYPKDLWSFEAASGSWLRKADMANTYTSNSTFSDATNGYTLEISSGILLRYSPITNLWSRMGDFPRPNLFFATTASISQKGYVFNNVSDSFFNQYDPSINSWSQLVSLDPLNSRIGFTVNNKFYFALGNKLTSFTNVVYFYDVWELDMTYYPK
jgi:N-acetylneuraminic acid mutarotase